MKFVAAIFLFSAFVAGIQAEDLDDDRHPYVQCKIDLYNCVKLGQKGKLQCLSEYKSCMAVLLPTIPPAVDALMQCHKDLYKCKGEKPLPECMKEYRSCLAALLPTIPPAVDALMQCQKEFYKCVGEQIVGECMKEYKSCMGALLPTIPPAVDAFAQCQVDLVKCGKQGGVQGAIGCLKTYKSCMLALFPTVPPFAVACGDELDKCGKAASSLKSVGACGVDYFKCLYRGPVAPPAPGALMLDSIESDEPMMDVSDILQCKKDLVNCIKAGTDLAQCGNNYKACMVAHLPTIPPHVKQCYSTAKTCVDNAGSFFEKWQCAVDMRKCLTNGASS